MHHICSSVSALQLLGQYLCRHGFVSTGEKLEWAVPADAEGPEAKFSLIVMARRPRRLETLTGHAARSPSRE
jgi:hypothetical protein